MKLQLHKLSNESLQILRMMVDQQLKLNKKNQAKRTRSARQKRRSVVKP